MSSPQMKTFGSRRISSARASRTASARVSSRVAVAVSGIDVLIHLVGSGVGSINGELHGVFHFRLYLRLNLAQARWIYEATLRQEFLHRHHRVPLGLPGQFFLLRAIVFACDVADVMAVEPVGIAEQDRGTFPFAGALD